MKFEIPTQQEGPAIEALKNQLVAFAFAPESEHQRLRQEIANAFAQLENDVGAERASLVLLDFAGFAAVHALALAGMASEARAVIDELGSFRSQSGQLIRETEAGEASLESLRTGLGTYMVGHVPDDPESLVRSMQAAFSTAPAPALADV
jgi:hypothetical protein